MLTDRLFLISVAPISVMSYSTLNAVTYYYLYNRSFASIQLYNCNMEFNNNYMVYLQYLNRFDRNEKRIEERDDAFEVLDDDYDLQSSYQHVLKLEKQVMDIFLVTEGSHVNHIFLPSSKSSHAARTTIQQGTRNVVERQYGVMFYFGLTYLAHN